MGAPESMVLTSASQERKKLLTEMVPKVALMVVYDHSSADEGGH